MARSDEQIGEQDGFLVREIHDPTTHLYAFRLTRELEAVEVEKGGRDRGKKRAELGEVHVLCARGRQLLGGLSSLICRILHESVR